MNVAEPEPCDQCNGNMAYFGRTSLPARAIYRCESCGNEKWAAIAPPPYRPHRMSAPVEKPHQAQQQQQQPQQKPKIESDK